MKGEVLDEAALVMHPDDTVATALADLSAGVELPTDEVELRVDGEEASRRDGPVTLREDVPFGHKVALRRMEAGDRVYKYGEVIGTASARIGPGEWVHTHNCESRRGRGDVDAAEEERTGGEA